jgi:hypothetical protein
MQKSPAHWGLRGAKWASLEYSAAQQQKKSGPEAAI